MKRSRRTELTKRLMKEALLELLEARPLNKISVSAVCAAADVNRSTFYRYYADPAQLLREIEDDVVERMPEPPGPPDGIDEARFLQRNADFFDYVRANARAFRVLLAEPESGSLYRRLSETICERYLVWDAPEAPEDAARRYKTQYIAGGSLRMLIAWVREDFPVGGAEFARMVYEFSGKVMR